MHVEVIDTPPLGDRSYLVHDGQHALVVDPQRDVDRVEAAAERAGVRITHVAETHIHNDYLTGGLVLARRHAAAYLLNAVDPVGYDRVGITGGQQLEVGGLVVEVVATPGHTDTHLAYVVHGPGGRAVFSGGSLLYGSVGRTDLLGVERATELAVQQHASVRRLATAAGPDALLYPTHGFGSFCAAGPASGTAATPTTVGHELLRNGALLEDDVERFVGALLAGFTAYPTYYAHMGPSNLRGPGEVELAVPEPISPDDLRRRLDGDGWVIDMRHRVAYARDHLVGTTSFEYGDGGSFTSYVGWLVPRGASITLIGSRDQVERGIRDLARIGFDRPAVAVGEPGEIAPGHPTGSYPIMSWDMVRTTRTRDDVVLDVRRVDEYVGGHLAGAINIPVHELRARLDELPRDRRVLVHCAAGYRAGIAASMLHAAGFEVVHVDQAFEAAASSGLTVRR